METNVKWKCKSCGTENNIDLNDSIIRDFRNSIKKDVETEYKRREEEFSAQLERATNEIREQTRNESLLTIKGKEKLISDLKDQLTKVREKLENNSQQLIGEMQELELESILADTFPTDHVQPVGKGIRGADCTLYVRSSNGTEIGSILFECKRVKSFSEDWITKLKTDNLQAKCNVMVIITAVMPKDMPGKFGLRDGVWICVFEPEAIRQLVLTLRYGLLKIYEIVQNQKLSGTHAEKIYEFITSSQFQSMMEHVLKGFKALEDSFQDERKKLTALWKLREAHVKEMLSTVLELFGTMRGISPEILQVESLMLPQVD